MDRIPPGSCWTRLLTLVLAILLTTRIPLVSTQLIQGGSRAEGCAVAYNNRFYVLGGTVDFNNPAFMSTPLPLDTTNNATWTIHPNPLLWVPDQDRRKLACTVSQVTQKIYMFGNAAGVSSFDLVNNIWEPVNLINSPVTMPQFQNQIFTAAATHADGRTISVMVVGPPTFLRIDTVTNTVLTSAPIPSFSNMTGFCSAIHPITDNFIACGGSPYFPTTTNVADLSINSCTIFGSSANIISQSVGLHDAQYGCSLVPSTDSLVLIPGRLDSYKSLALTNTLPAFNAPFELLNGTSLATVSVPNQSYGLRLGMQVAAMPGTGKAIINGGWSFLTTGMFLLPVPTFVLDLKTLTIGTSIAAALVLPSYGNSTTGSTTGSSTTPKLTPPSSSSGSSTNENNNGEGGMGSGLIAGLVAAAVVVCALIGGFAIHVRRQRRKSSRSSIFGNDSRSNLSNNVSDIAVAGGTGGSAGFGRSPHSAPRSYPIALSTLNSGSASKSYGSQVGGESALDTYLPKGGAVVFTSSQDSNQSHQAKTTKNAATVQYVPTGDKHEYAETGDKQEYAESL